MKVKVLVENKANKEVEVVKPAHGLSLFLESDKKILVDLGESDLFINNANKMGISIEDIDIVVISHGHSDHIGGLPYFLKLNSKARIFIHSSARDRFFAKLFNLIPIEIGLKKEFLNRNSDRFIFIDKDMDIDDNLKIVCGFNGCFKKPESNRVLYKKVNGKMVPDDFNHELALIVTEGGNSHLISSCSHSGIYNIIESAISRYSYNIKSVIGGFHLYNPLNGRSESDNYIKELGSKLNSLESTKYYTGHCTGRNNITRLKKYLGDRIAPISIGDSFIV